MVLHGVPDMTLRVVLENRPSQRPSQVIVRRGSAPAVIQKGSRSTPAERRVGYRGVLVG
jgi:hypothetical protein